MPSSAYEWSDLESLYIGQQLTCDQIAKIKGCSNHAVRFNLNRLRIPRRSRSDAAKLSIHKGRIRTFLKGTNHPNWKNGRARSKQGYVYVRIEPSNPFFPMARKDGYVFEHRLVMAQHLGRCLQPWEHVHHKDYVKDHNEYSNLQLTTAGRHLAEHNKAYKNGYHQGYLNAQLAIFNPLKLQNDALVQHITRVNLQNIELLKQIKLLQWQIGEKERHYDE